MYSFPNLEPVCCSMSNSNCCFLTCIQISQEVGQVVWYYHLLKNFPQFIVIHTVKGFQFSLVTQSCLTAIVWTAAHQASLSITNSWSLPKLISIESVKPHNHLILSHPLLLLPPIFLSIRVFSNESTLLEVAKILDFQLQHQSFQWTLRTDFL